MRNRAFVLLALAAACGSDSTAADAPTAAFDAPAAATDARAPDAPGNALAGTIAGMTFGASDAIANVQTGSGFELGGPATYVLMTSFGGACDKQASSTGVPGGQLLILGLAVVDAQGTSTGVLETGTYTVYAARPALPAKVAQVFYEKDGADCRKSTNLEAGAGTVTITKTGGPIEGAFDLTFGSDHVTGSFSAATCGALNVNRTPLGGC